MTHFICKECNKPVLELEDKSLIKTCEHKNSGIIASCSSILHGISSINREKSYGVQ